MPKCDKSKRAPPTGVLHLPSESANPEIPSAELARDVDDQAVERHRVVGRVRFRRWWRRVLEHEAGGDEPIERRLDRVARAVARGPSLRSETRAVGRPIEGAQDGRAALTAGRRQERGQGLGQHRLDDRIGGPLSGERLDEHARALERPGVLDGHDGLERPPRGCLVGLDAPVGLESSPHGANGRAHCGLHEAGLVIGGRMPRDELRHAPRDGPRAQRRPEPREPSQPPSHPAGLFDPTPRRPAPLDGVRRHGREPERARAADWPDPAEPLERLPERQAPTRRAHDERGQARIELRHRIDIEVDHRPDIAMIA